jgi:hypothetical protein
VYDLSVGLIVEDQQRLHGIDHFALLNIEHLG